VIHSEGEPVVPLPDDRVAASLYTEIKVVCDMMLKTHYFEEANWLWMAVSAPQSCKSRVPQAALQSARRVAREFGFPRVAQWIAPLLLDE
jgi:hypothetical protein